LKNNSSTKQQNRPPMNEFVKQLNDIHDGFSAIRKVTSFLGTAAINAAQHLGDDDVEGAEFCFRMLNENIMAELDNLDNLIMEVKSI
jgi:hypothetical protein